MSELKPCPFCGGDPVAIETRPGRGELYCGNCDVVLGGNNAMTAEELTDAWNTRAKVAFVTGMTTTLTDNNEIVYRRADRCRVVTEEHDFEPRLMWKYTLSCGHIIEWARGYQPKWCPYCGKKVDE